MIQFEVDVELVAVNNILDNDLRASILESVLKELSIPFERFFVNRENRTLKRKDKVYTEEDETTIMFYFKCSENYYNYTLFLFKKKAKDLEKVLRSYEA